MFVKDTCNMKKLKQPKTIQLNICSVYILKKRNGMEGNVFMSIF